jgi:hypothetical protein
VFNWVAFLSYLVGVLNTFCQSIQFTHPGVTSGPSTLKPIKTPHIKSSGGDPKILKYVTVAFLFRAWLQLPLFRETVIDFVVGMGNRGSFNEKLWLFSK